ncbi:DUF4222 domain-containing protein [Salmonella enterica]|nr:DUF4222 domain-containing protein [Salmonella enterica]EBU3701566.1 DUF4222 domain-containing protein [Salmonella enterica]
MKINKTGCNSGGSAHPEICIGDRWKDSHGSIITITEHQLNRVIFYREGYHSPCMCAQDRLHREFTLVEKSRLTGKSDLARVMEAKGAEKIRIINEIINHADTLSIDSKREGAAV